MKKILILVGGIIAVLVLGFFALNSYIYNEKQAKGAGTYKDAEYVIGSERIKLVNGVAEQDSAPGSASKTITRYFGNDLIIDLNADGREDVVFLLTQETGGSGTFYYVVAALNTERGYLGSEGVFLGDRIAPQSIDRGERTIIVVNYADRAQGDDFATPPSVGKSIWLKLDTNTLQFGEVAQNFEGEADPSRMSLSTKTWIWDSALYNDGRELKPRDDSFTLTFKEGGEFSATTDCNSMAGTYRVDANTISFSNIARTEKYCAGSKENEFFSLLTNAHSYHFTSRGQLVLDLKFDSGSVIFR